MVSSQEGMGESPLGGRLLAAEVAKLLRRSPWLDRNAAIGIVRLTGRGEFGQELRLGSRT